MESNSNARQVWPARVLDLTRATVAYGDLAAGVEALAESLTADIHPEHSDERESLLEALTSLHNRTTDQWLKGTPVWWGFYEQTRHAAIARAAQLQALAADIATAAHHIGALLVDLGPLDTPDRLEALITEAASCLEDGADTPDLANLWHRLGPSDLVDAAAAVALRRQFDAEIDTTNDTTLFNAVTAWRSGHLTGEEGPITWDAATFRYVIATPRAWAELVEVWEKITTAAHAGLITAAEGIRLRDAIVDRVRAGGSTPAMPQRLREILADYDTSSISLMARIRHAEEVETLERVWSVLREPDRTGGPDLERLGLACALLRNTRKMQLTACEPEGDVHQLTRLNDLMRELNDWHRRLFVLAGDIAEGRADEYSHDEAYTVLYHALAAADDTGNTARRQQLLGYVEGARQRGRLTDDHYGRILAMPVAASPRT